MRIRLMVAVVVILAATLGAAIPAAAVTQNSAHPARAAILTTPTVDYLMSGKSDGFYHTIATSTISNPSNYAIRAGISCNNGDEYYGAWGSGLSGSSASCPSGVYGDLAFAQFDKTHKYQLSCWVGGLDPVSGEC
jgi:hypothetical protein